MLLESSIGLPALGEVDLAAQMAKHEGLVGWVVRRAQRWGMPFDEAVQEGRIGLWRALRGFDPAWGTAFSSYAVVVIRRAVWDAVAKYRAQGVAVPTLSPDRPTHKSGLVWPDHSGALLEALEAEEVNAELRRLLGQLPPRQRQIVVAHYGLDGQAPLTFGAIGGLLGVTRQRVQQLHLAALVWLGQPSRSVGLRRLCGRNQRTDYQRAFARQYRLARMGRAGRRGRQ